MIEEQQPEAREASVGALIRSVADDAVLLVRTEAQLAISEARLAVAGMRVGGVLLAVAGALLFAAVIILLVALSFLQRHPGLARHHVNISGAARALPFSIAIRSLQREAIRLDPRWNGGHYDDAAYPESGMRMARKHLIRYGAYL